MIATLLFHFVFSGFIAFLLAALFGGLSPWIAAISLALGSYLALKPGKSLTAQNPDWRVNAFTGGEAGIMERVLFAFVLFISWRHFAWMLFRNGQNLTTLSPNNFGDLPLHINYIRAMSSGISFPPINPSFAAEPLRYPFGPDLYNALWEALGVNLSAHLFVVGMCAALASLVMLRSYASWWGIGGFFLSGGVWIWGALKTGVSVVDVHAGVDWKNLFLTVFITQRGMLFALPIGILLLNTFRRQLSREVRLSRSDTTALGLMWGILPLFHTHTFVIVSLMLALLAFSHMGWRGLLGFFKSPMARFAYLPAFFFVWRSSAGFQKASITHLSWGWMAPVGKFGSFVLNNFGPWLLLPVAIAIALVVSRKRLGHERSKQLWLEFAAYLILWCVFFNVMLAPWSWDNIKVLIWPYLGMTRIAWVTIEPWFAQRTFGDLIRWSIAITLFSSGFAAIAYSIQTPKKRGIVVYSTGELANATGAMQGNEKNAFQLVPSDAVFAAAPTHQHVLTWLGRLRVLGYEGHLWSHGIDASKVKEQLDRLMKGDPDWLGIAHRLGVTHIFWGPTERATYGSGQRPWMSILPNVSRVPEFAIYAIKQ